jgi:dodecin
LTRFDEGAGLGFRTTGGTAMSDMLKVIEVLAESDKSWEDAAAQAVANASKTLHGIRSIYIENLEAKVDGNKIVSYRINGKISFMLE